MIYEFKIADEGSGEKALMIAHWCGKNLQKDISFIFTKNFMSVNVIFYIDEEDDETFKEKWGY